MEYGQPKYSELTDKIVRSALKVHAYFGSGFAELEYQKSLMVELESAGLKFTAGTERNIYYHNRLVGKRWLDLVVEEQILVEVKAIKEIDKSSYNQIINYLKVFDLEVGLLLNFGGESLQFKRFVANRKHS
jgi:GxxExxY protein